MNLEVLIRLLRDRPLAPEELDALCEHVRRRSDAFQLMGYDLHLATEPRSDGLVAMGRYSTWYDPDEPEIRMLLEALTELRGVVAGATLEVWDSFELIGWDRSQDRFEMMGVSDVPPFDLPRADSTLTAISSLDSEHRFAAWTAVSEAEEAPAPSVEAVELLTLVGQPELEPVRSAFDTRLSVRGWLQSGEVPAHVDSVQLRLHAESGALVALDRESLDQVVEGMHRMELSYDLRPATLEAAHTAELVAEVRTSRRLDLGARPIQGMGTVVPGKPPLVLLDLGEPEVEPPLPCRISAQVDEDYESVLLVFVELWPAPGPQDRHAQLRVALCATDGSTLASDSAHVHLDGAGISAVARLRMSTDMRAVLTASHLEISLEDTASQRVGLGRWSLGD